MPESLSALASVVSPVGSSHSASMEPTSSSDSSFFPSANATAGSIVESGAPPFLNSGVTIVRPNSLTFCPSTVISRRGGLSSRSSSWNTISLPPAFTVNGFPFSALNPQRELNAPAFKVSVSVQSVVDERRNSSTSFSADSRYAFSSSVWGLSGSGRSSVSSLIPSISSSLRRWTRHASARVPLAGTASVSYMPRPKS